MSSRKTLSRTYTAQYTNYRFKIPLHPVTFRYKVYYIHFISHFGKIINAGLAIKIHT